VKKLNISVIGAGRISQLAYLDNLINDKRIKNISLCDKNKILLKKVSIKYKIKKIYFKISDILKNEDPDIVVLVVNRLFNHILLEKIIRHKKNFIVFCEKPFAPDFKTGSRLVSLAKKNKKKLLIGYMKRFDPSIRYIKRKKMENIKLINYLSYDGNSYEKSSKYIKYKFTNKIKDTLKKKYLNTQSHSINLIQYLFGRLKLNYKLLNKNGEGIVLFENKKKIKFILENKFNKNELWKEEIKIFTDNLIFNIELPAPFFKKKIGKISILNLLNKKKKKILVRGKWSFKNQLDELIRYSSKSSSRKKAISTELCTAQQCLSETKIVDKIFI